MNGYLKLSGLGSIILLGLFIFRFELRRTYMEFDPIRKAKREAQIKLNNSGEDKSDILFIGNSLINLFDVYKYTGVKVGNKGIGGETTAELLERLPMCLSEKHTKVFIEIGINDVLHRIEIAVIMENYEAIIGLTKKLCPMAEIYVHSLLPTCFDDGWFADNKYTNEVVVKLNQHLKLLTKNESVNYVDLHKQFLVNKKLDSDLSFDGVHLNEKGYKKWAASIQPLLNLSN